MSHMNFFDPEMNAATNCVRVGMLTKGRVVQATHFDNGRKVSKPNRYGYIVGFSVSITGELILCVEYESGLAFELVHPGNLILL
jgi:hypothetical protein